MKNTVTKRIFSTQRSSLRKIPNFELSRTVLTFQLLKSPYFVNFILKNISKPGIGPILRYWTKSIAFPHFCGGVSIDDGLLHAKILYNRYQIFSIVDHSTEESISDDGRDENLNSKIDLLTRLKGQHEIRFIPLKCTSLISPVLLESINQLILQEKSPNGSDDDVITLLSPSDVLLFQQGVKRFSILCEKAQEVGVSLLLDAEQSPRQPAIDLLYRRLASQYNQPRSSDDVQSGQPIPQSATSPFYPLIYNTYQMYLTSSHERLRQDLNHARRGGYHFAGKIVRGAYLRSEKEREKQSVLGKGSQPISSMMVFESKERVDKEYTSACSILLDTLASSSTPPSVPLASDVSQPLSPYLMFATHNSTSIKLICQGMQERGIAPEDPRLAFAQILGMNDHLAIQLADEGYHSYKLVCFGEYDQVFPWLLRRFEENRDVLGGVQHEFHLYWNELKSRLIPFGNKNKR